MYSVHMPPQLPVVTLQQTAVTPVDQQVERIFSLRPEQVVQATVAEGGLDRIYLELGPWRMPARTQVPLPQGAHLTLQVTQTEPEVALRILPRDSLHFLFSSLNQLGTQQRFLQGIESLAQQTAFPTLKNLFAQLLQQLRQPPSSELLQTFNRNLGLYMEQALLAGDKEGALQSLQGQLLQHVTQGDDSAADTVLQKLLFWQLCHVRLSQAGYHFVPLPFTFLEQGYLLAQNQGGSAANSGGQTEQWKFSLFLELTNLGPIEAHLLQQEQSLYVQLAVAQEEAKPFLRSMVPTLCQRLEKLGWQEVSAHVRSGARYPDKALLQYLVPEGTHAVDQRV